MIIATFNSGTSWMGKTITFDDRRFMLEGYGEILPAGVMEYDASGLLDWAYDGLREWAASLAPAAPQPRELRDDIADRYEEQFTPIPHGGRPNRRYTQSVYQTVDQCQDETELRAMREGAQRVWNPRTFGYMEKANPGQEWLEELVEHINVRLRAFRQRSAKPPAIVGEMHHQQELTRVFNLTSGATSVRSRKAALVPEPQNPYDANAVAVVVRGEVIGYLKRNVAATYSAPLQRLGRPLDCEVRLERQVDGAILAFLDDVLPAPSALL